MIIPAALLSIIPVIHFRKVNTKYLVFLFTTVICISVIGGATVAALCHIQSNIIILLFSPIFFLLYARCYDLSLQKKLFCFLNSSMICGFCTMYSTFVTAPLEVGSDNNVFTIISGLICLGITLIIGGAFFWTLYKKLSELLDNKSLDKLWSKLLFLPLVMTVIMIWMTPLNPQNTMVGRIRMVSMVVLLLIPIALWFIFHIMWWITKRMSENAQLQQSHAMLKM